MTLIPAFNESATIGDVVERALAYGPVLVVDDGSTDDTAVRAEAAGAEVIRHPRRLGKGQAIRSGMAAASIRGATWLVTLDGDGQHDPRDIPRLSAAAEASPGALVIGGRLDFDAGIARGRLNAIRVAGFFVNWATGRPLEDTQSGFRLYPLPLARELSTRRGGFVFETEVLVAAARQGIGFREVTVSARPRVVHRSRFRPFGDGARIGTYLTGQGIGRWRRELVDACGTFLALFSRERRAARHAALLLGASPYGPDLWGAAVGAEAGRRALARVTGWWRHPRRRRAAAVASGTMVLPLVGGLGLCQIVLDRLGSGAPDVVTPVVKRWFSQERLARLETGTVSFAGGATTTTRHAPSLAAPPGVAS